MVSPYLVRPASTCYVSRRFRQGAKWLHAGMERRPAVDPGGRLFVAGTFSTLGIDQGIWSQRTKGDFASHHSGPERTSAEALLTSSDSGQAPPLRVPWPSQALLPRSTGSARAAVPRYRPSRNTRSAARRRSRLRSCRSGAQLRAYGYGRGWACRNQRRIRCRLQIVNPLGLGRARATARRGCGKMLRPS